MEAILSIEIFVTAYKATQRHKCEDRSLHKIGLLLVFSLLKTVKTFIQTLKLLITFTVVMCKERNCITVQCQKSVTKNIFLRVALLEAITQNL
jgi:hypothetical protein